MPFDTYANLQTEVVSWLHRPNMAARVPSFIALAEAAINRKLNIVPKEIEVPLVLTIGSRFVPKPIGMSQPIALWLEQEQPRKRLTAALPEAFEVNAPSRGAPSYWAIDGANIAFDVAADQAYQFSFRYVQDMVLSDASPISELLTRAPDLYLYGALAQAAPYMRDDARVGMWESKFQSLLRQVHAEYSRSKSVAPLMTDVPSSLLNSHWSR